MGDLWLGTVEELTRRGGWGFAIAPSDPATVVGGKDLLPRSFLPRLLVPIPVRVVSRLKSAIRRPDDGAHRMSSYMH